MSFVGTAKVGIDPLSQLVGREQVSRFRNSALTIVIVTWADGSRWVASFFSYKNIQTLTQKNKRIGECLSGAYFWSSDMLLIDKVSRQRIEEVIDHLIRENEFETVFTQLPPEEVQEG
jgi:hypothetical protein